MYKIRDMKSYNIKYKTIDIYDFSEHFAEYNVQAYNIMEAKRLWEDFVFDFTSSSDDLIELIRITPKISHAEFEKIKWMIEG